MKPIKERNAKANRKTQYGREISNGTHKAMVYNAQPCVHLINLSIKKGMDVWFDDNDQREAFLDVIFNRD